MTFLFFPKALTARGAFFIFALLIAALTSCATYQSEVESARTLMQEKRFDEALKALEEKKDNSVGDKLAFTLEYATILHQAGRYKESNEMFARADKLSDVNDYTSVSREAGAFMIQEGLVQYKAETFEFLLINIYQALNYIMLGDYENAQVMARRLNEKINKIEIDKESKKSQASFAAYLAAMMWEAMGDWDNAFILYKKAHEGAPEMDAIKRDLLVAAKRSGRSDDYERLQKQWPTLDKNISWKNVKNQGEFVLIFQQGWIPRKRARPENKRFPMMVPQPAEIYSVDAKFDGQLSAHSETVYDLQKISIQTLDADYARLIARAVGRQASRVAIREAARNNKDNAALAVASIATLIFDVTEHADLRQWSTLPQSFQVIRTYLSAGKHSVEVTAYGKPEQKLWKDEVQIPRNSKIFRTLREY